MVGGGGGGGGRSEDERTDVKLPKSRNFSHITKNRPNKNCTPAELIALLKMIDNEAECFVLIASFPFLGGIFVDFLRVQHAKIKPYIYTLSGTTDRISITRTDFFSSLAKIYWLDLAARHAQS